MIEAVGEHQAAEVGAADVAAIAFVMIVCPACWSVGVGWSEAVILAEASARVQLAQYPCAAVTDGE